MMLGLHDDPSPAELSRRWRLFDSLDLMSLSSVSSSSIKSSNLLRLDVSRRSRILSWPPLDSCHCLVQSLTFLQKHTFLIIGCADAFL